MSSRGGGAAGCGGVIVAVVVVLLTAGCASRGDGAAVAAPAVTVTALTPGPTVTATATATATPSPTPTPAGEVCDVLPAALDGLERIAGSSEGKAPDRAIAAMWETAARAGEATALTAAQRDAKDAAVDAVRGVARAFTELRLADGEEQQAVEAYTDSWHAVDSATRDVDAAC